MLSPAHRRSIHSSFVPILGEEETDALMSELPASEADAPATKTDLTLLDNNVQAQLTLLDNNVQTQLALLRSDVQTDLALLRSDVQRGLTLLDGSVQTQLAGFRAEMHGLFRQMAMWVAIAIVTAVIGGMGLAAGIGAAVGT